jgi:hypothetical protein
MYDLVCRESHLRVFWHAECDTCLKVRLQSFGCETCVKVTELCDSCNSLALYCLSTDVLKALVNFFVVYCAVRRSLKGGCLIVNQSSTPVVST